MLKWANLGCYSLEAKRYTVGNTELTQTILIVMFIQVYSFPENMIEKHFLKLIT